MAKAIAALVCYLSVVAFNIWLVVLIVRALLKYLGS